ncbi:MAG TPA: hypothetical protein VGA64_07180 [Candidatus Polarisedimenticolia bacterium]
MTQRDDVDIVPILARLTGDAGRHARFLNTLSLLEYIGVRKILKSQPAEGLSAEMLEHILEEARHAYVLKRLALRVGGESVATYAAPALLCGEEARRYIQTLDRSAEIDLKESRDSASGATDDAVPAGGVSPASGSASVNYLYTTLLIEERAGAVYPLYEPLLARVGLGGVLAGIIREEEGHLSAVMRRVMDEDPGHAPRLERLRRAERRAYAAFVAALDRESAPAARPAST